VDTGLSGSAFCLFGRDIPENGMEPLTIVVSFDVDEQIVPGGILVWVASLMHEFSFQSAEAAFHRHNPSNFPSGLLDMPIPADAKTRAKFELIVTQFREVDHRCAIDVVVDRIDELVGPPLGLNAYDLASIRTDMTEDPFLKNITPRWPRTETRLRGYRT
jgi:hypothetical protein